MASSNTKYSKNFSQNKKVVAPPKDSFMAPPKDSYRGKGMIPIPQGKGMDAPSYPSYGGKGIPSAPLKEGKPKKEVKPKEEIEILPMSPEEKRMLDEMAKKHKERVDKEEIEKLTRRYELRTAKKGGVIRSKKNKSYFSNY